jgi:uncharacterized protein
MKRPHFIARSFLITLTVLAAFPGMAAQMDMILIQYAMEGDAGGADAAIKNGADPNTRDSDDMTPLMHSARGTGWIHFDTMKTLLNWPTVKAGINHHDKNGKTALMHAREVGNTRGADYLIQNGADPNLKPEPTKKGGGQAFLGAINSLLKKTEKAAASSKVSLDQATTPPAHAPAANTTIVSPAPAAAAASSGSTGSATSVAPSKIEISTETGEASLIDLVKQGEITKVREHLENTGMVNMRDGNSWTALMYASAAGRDDLVSLLLENGAEPNVQDPPGWTALMLAANQGSPSIVESLIKKQADVNAMTSKNTTALIVAAGRGHLQVVRMLCSAFAKLSVKDGDGKTALNYALEKGHTEVVDFLREQGARE